MNKEIVFTKHGRLACEARGIKRAWVKRAVHDAETVLSGKRNPGSEVCRRIIDEADGRLLSVVLAPTRRKALVVTAYWVDSQT